MKRLVIRLGLALLVVVLALGAFRAYNIYRVVYGKHVYETTPPALPEHLNDTAILVFSKTSGYRHAEAIPVADAAFAEIANKHGWSLVFTENGAVFNPEMLARFKTTVWNNTSGDTLNTEQKTAFRNYIENGGGFVGIHSAGGDFHYDWDWYPKTLIGAQFKGHPLNPQFQQATVHIEDSSDPAMAGLNNPWVRTDEWYSFNESPRRNGVHVLATLDESTYRPKMFWKDISMGADHPTIWKHCVGNGRVFYSAMGHTAASYTDPAYVQVLEHAIAWSSGLEGSDCGR